MAKMAAKGLLLLGTAAMATPALAQTAPDGPAAETQEPSSEDIIVTARLTAERLQDVPIAISALTGEQLAARGARGLEDVARATPGFAFERTTGSLAQPVIRGQAQSRLTNPVQNVATFFNGVYLQRAYQIDSDLLELDRIEVIKGPQSALFGRNAFAGAVSFITRRPDLQNVRIRADATVGDRERYELRGSLSVPLLRDIAAVSFAYGHNELDGTWANNHPLAEITGGAVRTTGRVNGYNNNSWIGQALVKPFDQLELYGFWSHRDINVEAPANYQIASIGLISGFNTHNCTPFQSFARARLGTNALTCGPLPAQPVLAPGEPRAPGIVNDPRTFGQIGETDVASAIGTLRLAEPLALVYQFSHTRAETVSSGTLSRDPARGVAAPGPFFGRVLFDSRGNGDLRSDNHELRLQYDTPTLRLLAGGFHSRVRDFDYGSSYAATPLSAVELTNVLFPGGDLFPPGFAATLRNERIRAVFGLASLEFVSGLRVTAEARQTWERIRQQAATFPARTPTGRLFEREFNYFTPRFTVDYQPNDDLLFYVSAARGVKSGGFNANATLADEQVYEPETNWTYEIGAKSTLWNGLLTLNAALFHVDWTGLQINRAQTNGTVGTPLIIGNISGATVNGGEISAVLRPTRGLTINAGSAYNLAKFNDDATDPVIPRALCQTVIPPGGEPCPYTAEIGGRRVPRAPTVQANLGAEYRGNLSAGLRWFARADAAYQGKQFVDNTNTGFIPRRTIVDANIGLESEWWTLRAFVRNLLDEQYVSYAFATFAGSGPGSGATISPLLGDRRTMGLTLSLRYN